MFSDVFLTILQELSAIRMHPEPPLAHPTKPRAQINIQSPLLCAAAVAKRSIAVSGAIQCTILYRELPNEMQKGRYVKVYRSTARAGWKRPLQQWQKHPAVSTHALLE
jgi:hypothetical protein